MIRELLHRLSNTALEAEELPTEPPAVEQPAIVGSERSQQSLLRESHLRLVMKQFTDAKTLCEQDVEKWEAEKQRATKQLFDKGYPSAEARFKDAVEQIAHERELIAAYDREIHETREKIDALIPGPEQLQERLNQQNQFAQLTAARLEQDRAAYGVIEELRRILDKRAELTSKMKEISKSLDLTVAYGDLDERRFDNVLGALPKNQFCKSEYWRDWFLGTSDGLAEYVVIDKELRIRETLIDSGFHVFGEKIKLAEEEARELLREDRPLPHNSGEDIWRRKPPSIMTVDAFEALTKRAQADGESIGLALM